MIRSVNISSDFLGLRFLILLRRLDLISPPEFQHPTILQPETESTTNECFRLRAHLPYHLYLDTCEPSLCIFTPPGLPLLRPNDRRTEDKTKGTASRTLSVIIVGLEGFKTDPELASSSYTGMHYILFMKYILDRDMKTVTEQPNLFVVSKHVTSVNEPD